MRTEFADRDAGGRGLQTFDLRTTIHAVTAVEAGAARPARPAPRRAGGRAAGRGPAARQQSRCSAICSMSATASKTEPAVSRPSPGANDDWFRLRHEEALTPDGDRPARRGGAERYGFNDFKLKGGVLRGDEGDRSRDGAGAALSRRRASRSTRTAPGRWKRPIRLCRGQRDVLAYAEDPCGAENGFSGREIMAEFRRATGLPTATNMIATDWRADGPCDPAARGRHPARRSAFLDDAGLGAGRADVPRLGPDLGLALEQSFRHFARDVHPRRRRRRRARSRRSTRTGSGRTASA